MHDHAIVIVEIFPLSCAITSTNILRGWYSTLEERMSHQNFAQWMTTCRKPACLPLAIRPARLC